MSKDEIIRFIQHFPVGLFAAWLTLKMPIVGIMFFIGFLFYQAIQDWRKVDWSYKDVIGFVCGYGTLPTIFYIISITH